MQLHNYLLPNSHLPFAVLIMQGIIKNIEIEDILKFKM